MAVVCRNDSSGPVRIPGRANDHVIQPGEVRTLSEAEYSALSFSLRGPGGVVTISPNETSSEDLKKALDYYTPSGDTQYEIRYLGYARQAALDTDAVWTISRYEHTQLGTQFLVTKIQVLTSVAWSNRATLPWT